MRRRWLLAATLLIGIVIVAALSLMKEPIRPEATLSDGNLVRFEKAGIGTISYDSYPPLKAALAGYVPNRFQSRLGERFQGTMTSQPHELGLLFSIWTPDGKRKRDPTQFLSRIESVESTGHVFKVGVSGYSSTNGLMCISEGPFPRRNPMLHLRLYERETDRLLFELHLPNPGYKPKFDEWKPEPVPATQTVEPLTVTLKNVPANITGDYLRDEDVEITSTDPRWTNTRPQWNFWVTDATGGKAYTLSGLSPFEPAWKLHLRVRRNESAEFSPDEVWRTKLIKMPAALNAARLKVGGVAAGVELSTDYVASAGEVRDDGTDLTVNPTHLSTQGGTSSGSGFEKGKRFTIVDSPIPFFQLSHSTLDEETYLIIVVKDQDGRKLTNDSSGSSVHNTGGISSRRVQFQPTPETTDVQLEVTVNRGRTFEFLVAPPKPAL